jgi:hypothetical protein
LRRPLFTPQCYTLSPPQDTSPVCCVECSAGVSCIVEAGVTAVGDVCVKGADGCGVSPDWERGVEPDSWGINAESVCVTGYEYGTKADGEGNEYIKADVGGDDIKTEGDSCVVLEFNLDTETVGTVDAKIAVCSC